MFRDLLMHVDGSQAGRRRVQLGVDLAGRMGARLSGLHVTPAAEVPSPYKPSRHAEVAADISARLASDARAAAAIFGEEAPDACWLEASGDVVLHISAKARYADLVILGQYEAQGVPETNPLPIAHSVVLGCGRPVLVVPDVAQPSALARAAIAWNGSREAVRAVHDALPLLHLSRSVQIVKIISPADDEGDELDAKRLSAHLTNHGIEVEANIRAYKENEALENLEGQYDLLVMGGYSHPMWWEFLFGGVTQSVLLSSNVPVFVSH
jgi:nucleotide-binding universal stress UspA family protein